MRSWLPLNSRTTRKETLSPSTLPSEMGASPNCPMVMVPVSLSPSTFNVKVFSIAPFGVSTVAFQVPRSIGGQRRQRTYRHQSQNPKRLHRLRSFARQCPISHAEEHTSELQSLRHLV